jgi:hypothetical protein
MDRKGFEDLIKQDGVHVLVGNMEKDRKNE